jgi:hypothetical protein
MTDNFQDPQVQAQLDALRSQLTSMDVQIVQKIDQAFRNLQQAQRSETARGRQAPVSARSPATALPSLQQEVQAVNEQVVSYERLNLLIAERNRLEARAAGTVSTARLSARSAGVAPVPVGVATVSSGTSVDMWLAQQRAAREMAAQKLAEAEHQSGSRKRWTTTSPEAQQTAVAVQSVRAAPTQAAAEAEMRAAQAGRAWTEQLVQLGANEQQTAVATKEAAIAAREFAAAQTRSAEATAKSAMAVAELDSVMSRGGALSTAAIQSMANGTITIRELGNQVAETVGKFGLWAGAAAAVYGVVGAFGAIKTGAVGVSSSVTALGRFLPQGQYNPAAARQSIIQQGRATATPLDQVGSTAQGFARAFKNQGDVFTATHVALTAAKLDTISLGDSYKYLTAIIQESGAKVSQLPAIFDQLTAAQDKLGARMSVMLPAFSGSVGAVQSAGGDPSQLIGLEALTAKRTGFDGSVISNMFRQGAARYFNTSAGRSARVTAGIDPNLGFTQALVEALAKAPGMTGTERNVLGNGFFGTRFGPRAAPLFRSTPAEVNRALGATAAGAHPGLANSQLSNAMSQADSQLKLLKVNLEAIGAELTGSKMTSPFSALLGVVNELLKATGDLVHAWDSLPGPVKTVGSDLAVAVGLMATARKFNLGGIMANSGNPLVRGLGVPLQKNPAKLLEERVSAGLDTLSSSISSRLAAAQTKQMASSLDLAAAQTEMAALDATGMRETDAYIAATGRAAAAQDALAAAQEEAARYVQMGSVENQAVMRTQMTAMAAGSAGATARVTGAGVPIVVPGAVAAGGAAAGGEAAAGGVVTQRLQAFSERMAAQVAAEDAAFGETMVLTSGMATLSAGTAAAAAGLASLAGLAIPGAIAAFLGFDAVKQSVQAGEKANSEGVARIAGATTADQARRGYNEVVSGGTWHVPLLGLGLPNFPSTIGNLLNGDDSAAKAALQSQLGLIHARQDALQASDRLLGSKVNPDLRAGNPAAAYKAFQKDRALQLVNPQQYNATLAQLQLKTESKATTGSGGKNPFATWEQASQDLLQQLGPMMQSTANAARVFGTKSGNLSSLAAGYLYAVQKFGNNPQNTQAMQVLAQAQTELVGAMSKQVQDLVDLAGMATTNKGQAGYYQQALGDIAKTESDLKAKAAAAEKIPGAHRGAIDQGLRVALGLVAKNRHTAITGLLDQYSSRTEVAVSQVGGVGPEADLQRAKVQLQGLETQLSSARKMGADATIVNGLMSKVNDQARTILQNRISYYQQLSQAETSYQQSGTADPVAQQQIAEQQLAALYTKLVAAGDKDKTQLLALLGQKRSAGLELVATQISREQAQSQASLSQANIGQPQQIQLANALSAAQKQLAYLQGLPKSQVNPQTLTSAFNNLYQAQGALAQFAIQQGQAMIQATTALQQGQTFDPVAIADAALKGAKQLLAYDTAHHMPAAQLKQDAAGVAAAAKSGMEASWQKQEATTQFLASTYQITGATEIQRLQSLMATMKKAHASYQEIQGVAQQVWNLEFGSGSLNLNTGNMHLPSTYEVKSAIMGGKLAQRRKTTAGLLAEVTTNVVMGGITINRDADIGKFSDAMNKALGTSVSGLAQAAGLV